MRWPFLKMHSWVAILNVAGSFRMFERPCLPHRDVYVYVNSLDPSTGCTLQAELIVTTSSGSYSSAMGECGGWEIPSCMMPLAWSVVQCLQRFVWLFVNFLNSPLSAHCLKPYFHRMYPRREGNFFNFREYFMYL